MKLEKIKIELDKIGYKSIIRKAKESSIGEYIVAGINDEVSNFKIGATFRIWIIDKKLLLDYISQIDENVFFNNEKDLINFIKEKFPIE